MGEGEGKAVKNPELFHGIQITQPEDPAGVDLVKNQEISQIPRRRDDRDRSFRGTLRNFFHADGIQVNGNDLFCP